MMQKECNVLTLALWIVTFQFVNVIQKKVILIDRRTPSDKDSMDGKNILDKSSIQFEACFIISKYYLLLKLT